MSFTWSPSVAMSWEEMDRFLQQKLVARLTSIRPDGYPHTTPLWYVWDGKALWFEIGAGERPRQTGQKPCGREGHPRAHVGVGLSQAAQGRRLFDRLAHPKRLRSHP
jgi:Pyridoxamine 5'-phosphate oxidase